MGRDKLAAWPFSKFPAPRPAAGPVKGAHRLASALPVRPVSVTPPRGVTEGGAAGRDALERYTSISQWWASAGCWAVTVTSDRNSGDWLK